MACNFHSKTLISPGASEEDGCYEFIENFERAYIPPGTASPPFHVGPLANAIKTAWARPAAEVKLLVVYLHREGNALTKRFLRIFQSGVVNQLLQSSCVLWGWDMTSELNENTLKQVFSNNLGYDNAWRLQMVSKMMYPCFIFLSRTHNKLGVEVVQFIKATADLNFAVSLFSNAVVTFCSKIKPKLILKEERNKTGRGVSDGVKTKANSLSHSPPRSPTDKKLAKGKPPLATDANLKDDGESVQSIAGALVGNAVDISALFDAHASQNPSNYPYHSQDETAKTRLAELKKQYLVAEYERLKAEKKAIFARLVQEESARNQAGPSGKGFASEPKLESRDWELRKKLKTTEKTPTENKLRTSPRSSHKQKTEDRSDIITLRFRSYKELFEKKFNMYDTFEKLLLFLTARGYSFRDYKILVGWPRLDISEVDSRTPLKNLNFYMRDNIILERRRATFPDNTF